MAQRVPARPGRRLATGGGADNLGRGRSSRAHAALPSSAWPTGSPRRQPYPATPDDSEAAVIWLVEHSLAELGSERLLIGATRRAAASSRSRARDAAAMLVVFLRCYAQRRRRTCDLPDLPVKRASAGTFLERELHDVTNDGRARLSIRPRDYLTGRRRYCRGVDIAR